MNRKHNEHTQSCGYQLWLDYRCLSGDLKTQWSKALSSVRLIGTGQIVESARSELQRALPELLGTSVKINDGAEKSQEQNPTLVIGTSADLLQAGLLPGSLSEASLQDSLEGWLLHIPADGPICLVSRSDRGILYGVFALLRLMQTGQSVPESDIADAPRLNYRILNHWDNPDGSIERGYAGQSIWQWDELPDTCDTRSTDYARACASVGLNASVLNNVNAAPEIITAAYLKKVEVIAGELRKWGIQTMLSVSFGSPMILGGLDSADPQDPRVAAWWKQKVDEIYRYIPDFGGFVVKADSEGQPGPYQYGRSHAEGANMLADALKPHKGILIWRAFVYGHGETDRHKKAYTDFVPHDGVFRDNAIVQVKNGAIDFMPREPFHPLFGAMPKTNMFMEFQVTQEYLGQGNHVVYLGPMWQEILQFDTYTKGPGSSVGDLLSEGPAGSQLTGMAAVANIGDDKTWCGSHMHPANWYAYGRLAWDYSLDAGKIAKEWIASSFDCPAAEQEIILEIMMDSWEACIDYMTPLGLHHIMREGHHYGPDPAYDAGKREDWRSTYYHKADSQGLGFDRSRTGSGAVEQYAAALADKFDSLETCPEEYLLWFHHVPWDYVLSSGRPLKDELVYRYQRGVQRAEQMRELWISLKDRIDEERWSAVRDKLDIQVKDAHEWQEVCTSYFMQFVSPI